MSVSCLQLVFTRVRPQALFRKVSTPVTSYLCNCGWHDSIEFNMTHGQDRHHAWSSVHCWHQHARRTQQCRSSRRRAKNERTNSIGLVVRSFVRSLRTKLQRSHYDVMIDQDDVMLAKCIAPLFSLAVQGVSVVPTARCQTRHGDPSTFRLVALVGFAFLVATNSLTQQMTLVQRR